MKLYNNYTIYQLWIKSMRYLNHCLSCKVHCILLSLHNKKKILAPLSTLIIINPNAHVFTYTFGLQNTLSLKGRKYTSIKAHALRFVMGKILLALGTVKTFYFYLWLLPSEMLFRVFPFKVLFHVQNSMHAIVKYCSSVEKTNKYLIKFLLHLLSECFVLFFIM